MSTIIPAGAPIGRDSPSAPATVHRAASVGTVASALLLYLCWTLATYLLEGRTRVLLRPDAASDRMLYVLVANVAIGTFASILLLRRMIRQRAMTARHAGFSSISRSVLAVLAGGTLGFAVYAMQGPT